MWTHEMPEMEGTFYTRTRQGEYFGMIVIVKFIEDGEQVGYYTPQFILRDHHGKPKPGTSFGGWWFTEPVPSPPPMAKKLTWEEVKAVPEDQWPRGGFISAQCLEEAEAETRKAKDDMARLMNSYIRQTWKVEEYEGLLYRIRKILPSWRGAKPKKYKEIVNTLHDLAKEKGWE